MSTLDVVALQRYGTTTILGISVVHGVAEPLRYVFIVAGRVIVCGYAATVITVTPQSLCWENQIIAITTAIVWCITIHFYLIIIYALCTKRHGAICTGGYITDLQIGK